MNTVRNDYENKLKSLVKVLTNIIETKEGTVNKKNKSGLCRSFIYNK